MQKPYIPVLVEDPVVNVDKMQYYAVLEGGDRVTYKRINSTSFSQNSISITAPPPSPHIYVSRDVLLEVSFRLTFAGTTSGNNLLQTGFDAPRAFPLASSINTTQVTINNTSISLNTSDVVKPLLRYNSDYAIKNQKYSMTPYMMDNYQKYSSATNTPRNPLGDAADNQYQMARGGFNYTIVSNTTTDAIVDLVVTENLYLSPFLFGHDDNRGFIGVQNMDFIFNFVSSLGSRIWCHSDDAPTLTFSIASVAVQSASLLFKYITPKQGVPVPRHAIYPYYAVQRYPTIAGSSMAPNSTLQIATQNIQLQSIPHRIYLFARRQDADRTVSTTDTYLALESLNVNWNNESGLLSSASQQDLYKIAVRNGLSDMSFPQWAGIENRMIGTSNQLHGQTGSVMCLQMGTDIALRYNEAPGLLNTYQLQINATFKNINQVDTFIPVFFIVVVSEGIFEIKDNQAISRIGVLDRNDIMQARQIGKPLFKQIGRSYGAGGNFLESIGDLGKKFAETVIGNIGIPRVLAEQAKDIAPAVAKLAPSLLGLGNGVLIDEYGGVQCGGKKRGRPRKKRKGGVLVGGRYIDRNELANRLR